MELKNSQVRTLSRAIDNLVLKYPKETINSIAKRHSLDIDADPKLLLLRLVISADDFTPPTVYELEHKLQQLRSRLHADDDRSTELRIS